MKTAEINAAQILGLLDAVRIEYRMEVLEKKLTEIKLEALKEGMTLALEEIIKARDNKKEL